MTEWENPHRDVWIYSTESFTLWLKDEQSRIVLRGGGLFVDYTGMDSFVLERASDIARELGGRTGDDYRRLADDVARAVATAPRGK